MKKKKRSYYPISAVVYNKSRTTVKSYYNVIKDWKRVTSICAYTQFLAELLKNFFQILGAGEVV